MYHATPPYQCYPKFTPVSAGSPYVSLYVRFFTRYMTATAATWALAPKTISKNSRSLHPIPATIIWYSRYRYTVCYRYLKLRIHNPSPLPIFPILPKNNPAINHALSKFYLTRTIDHDRHSFSGTLYLLTLELNSTPQLPYQQHETDGKQTKYIKM